MPGLDRAVGGLSTKILATVTDENTVIAAGLSSGADARRPAPIALAATRKRVPSFHELIRRRASTAACACLGAASCPNSPPVGQDDADLATYPDAARETASNAVLRQTQTGSAASCSTRRKTKQPSPDSSNSPADGFDSGINLIER
ncbi:MAG: hypothetical protein U0798_04710 [Gemmataceae bacterium]